MNKFEFETFINDLCDFMTARANYKEEINRKGFCDTETVGFVNGIRWCVSCIKSNLNMLNNLMEVMDKEGYKEGYEEGFEDAKNFILRRIEK